MLISFSFRTFGGPGTAGKGLTDHAAECLMTRLHSAFNLIDRSVVQTAVCERNGLAGSNRIGSTPQPVRRARRIILARPLCTRVVRF
jgi:hypothetical protein